MIPMVSKHRGIMISPFVSYLLKYRHGVTRFVGMTSWATRDDRSLPFIVRWVLRPLLIKHVLDSMYEMEQYTNTTELNYTIVRAPGLQDGECLGKISHSNHFDVGF